MNSFLTKLIEEKVPFINGVASKEVIERLNNHPNALVEDFNSYRGFLDTLMPFIIEEIKVDDYYSPYEDSGLIQRKALSEYGITGQMLFKLDDNKKRATDADFMHIDTIDEGTTPWKYRPVKAVSTRGYISNIVYNNYVSVPANFYYTSSFTPGNGMEMIIQINAAITKVLLTEYQQFRDALYREILAKNASLTTLTDYQKMTVSFADVNNPTADEVEAFVKTLIDFKNAYNLRPSKFNEFGFNKRGELKFYVLPGFKARLLMALKNIYHNDVITDPIKEVLNDMVEVPTLGAYKVVLKDDGNTPVYPVYSTNAKNPGQVIGFSATENATTVDYDFTEVEAKGASDDIVMIAVEDGRFFYATKGAEYILQADIFNMQAQFYNQRLMVLGAGGADSNGMYGGAALGFDNTKAYVQFKNIA